MYSINDLMNVVIRERAEELHLEPSKAPVMVRRGEPCVMDLPPLTNEKVDGLFRSFASDAQLEELRRCGDVHFNHLFGSSAQFAVTASLDRDTISLKIRNLGR